MIDKKTVLILGAGASMDFHFPSGLDLVGSIIRRERLDGEPGHCLAELGFTPQLVAEFGDVLRNSRAMSVDEFLATRPDLVNLGKAVIAASLMPFEQDGYVYNSKVMPSWLQVLCQRLNAKSAEWESNRLSIVTFNYDRVVEYALVTSLISRFNLSEEAAAEFLKKTVKIIHVHGQMGSLHGIGEGSPRAFNSNVTAHLLKIAAEGIKIVHEGKDGDTAFVTAREFLAAATEIVLMGFGYGETNMNRLRLMSIAKTKTIIGSSIGMTPRERVVAKRIAENNLALDDESQNLTMFLRSQPVLGN